MRTASLVLFLFTALSLAAADDVTFTEKKRDVEFCKPLGSVKAKSGWGGSAGCDMGIRRVKDTLAKRAAALGANHVLLEDISCGALGANGTGEAYACSAESLEKQRETQAECERRGLEGDPVRSGKRLRDEMVACDAVAARSLGLEVPQRDGHAHHDGRTVGYREACL
jgi:hypothetical protein